MGGSFLSSPSPLPPPLPAAIPLFIAAGRLCFPGGCGLSLFLQKKKAFASQQCFCLAQSPLCESSARTPCSLYGEAIAS